MIIHLQSIFVEAIALISPAVPHPSAALNACQLLHRHLSLRAGHGVRCGPLEVNDARGRRGGVQGHQNRQPSVSEILVGERREGTEGREERKGSSGIRDWIISKVWFRLQ